MYLNNRAEKGFNVIQVMVLHDLKVVNFYGDSALVNRHVSQPKVTPRNSFENAEEYDFWDHMDYIINLAECTQPFNYFSSFWSQTILFMVSQCTLARF